MRQRPRSTGPRPAGCRLRVSDWSLTWLFASLMFATKCSAKGARITRSALLLRGKIGPVLLFPIHVDQRRNPVNGIVAAHQLEGDPQRRPAGPLEAPAL